MGYILYFSQRFIAQINSLPLVPDINTTSTMACATGIETEHYTKPNSDICLGKTRVLYTNTQHITWVSTIYNMNNVIIYSLHSKIYVQNIYGDECVRLLQGHRKFITSICVKDNLIISCSHDKEIRIWDITRPIGEECIQVLGFNNTRKIDAYTFTPVIYMKDNLILVCIGNDKIYIWDINKIMADTNSFDFEDCLYILDGHQNTITTICFKDNLIISGSCDGTLRIWDRLKFTSKSVGSCNPDCNACIRVLEDRVTPIFPIKSTHVKDDLIISNSTDCTIRIWDISRPTGEECIRILQYSIHKINSIYINNFGNITITVGENNVIGICDINYSSPNSVTDSESADIKYMANPQHTSNCCINLQYSVDNLVILCSDRIDATPITLFPGEYELFTTVINSHCLQSNLVGAIWDYMTSGSTHSIGADPDYTPRSVFELNHDHV